MHEEIFRALEQGATLVTASHGLARVLTSRFHSRQRDHGRSFWNRPDILPLDAFLDRQWREWIAHGTCEEYPRLLDPLQQQLIWEQIIAESPSGETLLRIPATAQAAMHAWQLIQAYRLPVDGRFGATDDSAAFREWSSEFLARCKANRWIERARLSDFLIERIDAGEISRPSMICWAGFDELTPQQAGLLGAFGGDRIAAGSHAFPAIEYCKARDAKQEIWSAAEWARALLEGEPDTQIGVIVPDVNRSRATVERIFRQVLDSGSDPAHEPQAFHVSIGPYLAEYPLVRTALRILEFAASGLSMPEAGVLLRSPFLGGAESEWDKRALLDARLRKRAIWGVAVGELGSAAGSCPILQRALKSFEQELQKAPKTQSAAEWTTTFSRLLKALGWPGQRVLSSREHQLMEAWKDLLSGFAALDLAATEMSLAWALSRLGEIAAQTVFQIENVGAPIQIMGMWEAAGLQFDHLWIMGLDDETLPAAPNPNPFLPLSLQRENKLPHSSAEKELEFANLTYERLIKSAPDVVVSYAERAGDRALAPSPLTAASSWRTLDGGASLVSWFARLRCELEIEQLRDQIAPPITVEGMQPGGSSLFKDMAACPFRAFAKHRLHAKPLEASKPGLSYKDRGTAVHQALELIWRELGSHARLVEFGSNELRELVARHVDRAVSGLPQGWGRKLERRRLLNLLWEWFEIEKSREPFKVLNTEDERLVRIQGLTIRTRADRVDELPDGRVIVLDYKTGRLSTAAWDGDRPDEPQLPLYCVTSERAIAGTAFVQIRAGELGFRGLTDKDASLPAMRKMAVAPEDAFTGQLARWRHVLEKLAEDFRNGRAEVDPKLHACDNCGLTALCRIREAPSDR